MFKPLSCFSKTRAFAAGVKKLFFLQADGALWSAAVPAAATRARPTGTGLPKRLPKGNRVAFEQANATLLSGLAAAGTAALLVLAYFPDDHFTAFWRRVL